VRKIRGQRKKDHPLVLTNRDKEILLLAGLCRYVSAEQVAREFFSSDSRARRRIRQLYDAGYINVTLTSSTAPNLLSLSKDGLVHLKDTLPAMAVRMQCAGSIRLAGVQHHLALVDVRLYVAALVGSKGWSLLRWENGAGEMARKLGLGQIRLRPDSLFEIETSRDVLYCGVEVDCGGETMVVLDSKLERYQQVLGDVGLLDELWIVAISGKERRGTIERLVRQAGLEPWTRVLNHGLLLARPVVSVVAGMAEGGV